MKESRVYVVTIQSEAAGEVRAYVYAEDHKHALGLFMDAYPGISDMNTVYIAETDAKRVITTERVYG